MKIQEARPNKEEMLAIANSDLREAHKLARLATNKLGTHLQIDTLWDNVGEISEYVTSAICSPPHGYTTLTCPTTEVAAGESFTISIKATNDSIPSATGLYVIGISVAPFSSMTTLLDPLVATGFPPDGTTTQSPIITLLHGVTSAEYSWTYTMPTPAAPISVVCSLDSTCPP
jgi:hypothetical protein